MSVLDISKNIRTSGQILESFKMIFVGYFTMLPVSRLHIVKRPDDR
jgi:hypothetical protein